MLVTGATGGMGEAISLALANAGARVIVGYNSSLEKAQLLCQRLHGEGHVVKKTPVLESGALSQLAVEIAGELGRLDILVNNAGTTRYVAHEDLDGLDDALIDQIFNTNWRGAFACVRAFRSLLAAQGDGLVINISSIAALTAYGSNVAYCASKAAMNNMTLSLARALAPAIRVIAVSPGLVDTEFVRGLDPSWRDQQVDNTPLKRLASPSEVANAVLAAAQTLTFSTGCIIPVDGGRPLV
ncbi:SDR family oxidoreductase [Pseudomaricurvus alkylphenolicus]|uniref:SDR family oxidoreductase n=1 Tax=Pseudomaricurvus alkylphenolicus TaxID=1306991 RepID=UPI0019820B75